MKNFWILFVACVMLLVVGCGGDGDIGEDGQGEPILEVSTQTMHFPSKGETKEVLVTTNIDYDVVTNVDWLTVTKTSSGITVVAKAQYTTKERSAEITLSNNRYELTKTIEVVQAAMSNNDYESNCIIYYTTNNGQVVTPYKTGAFGATILSNTYENGQGILIFDAPITSIGDEAFYGRTRLASITIPEGVTTIGWKAFRYCTNLASITIPNSVTSIGNSAFFDCTSLASITIPNSVTSIGESAFQYCTNLASITIPNSVTSIGEEAFRGCTIASITIPNSVSSIGNYAFWGCTGELHIDSKVVETGNYSSSTWITCANFTSLTLGKHITKIGDYAFSDCTSLASITLPESLTTIGSYAFYDCTKLASITLPESLTTIGSYAFYGWKSLASITIPEGVTTIGKGAFLFCESLKSVYCKPTTPPSSGGGLFGHNGVGPKIYVPASDDDSIIKAYKAASYWSSYASDMEEYQF